MGDHYAPRRDYDRYSRPRYDEYGRGRYDDSRRHDYADPRSAGGYTFRGAADDRRDDRHPQEQFTFRAQGPPPPRFPPAAPERHTRSQHAPLPQSRFKRADERRPNGQRGPADSRGGATFRQGRRGRGGFASRPAHSRDILTSIGREPTPEQLEGMADGHARFREVSSSSDEAEVIDLTHDSDDDEAPRKRTKTNTAPDTAVPKWSNPDPYTVLPLPESFVAPKKDIVKVIRKGMAEAAPKSDARNAVQDNVDFIGFDMDDDFQSSKISEGVTSSPPASRQGSVHNGISGRDRAETQQRSQPQPSLPLRPDPGPLSRAPFARPDGLPAKPPAPANTGFRAPLPLTANLTDSDDQPDVDRGEREEVRSLRSKVKPTKNKKRGLELEPAPSSMQQARVSGNTFMSRNNHHPTMTNESMDDVSPPPPPASLVLPTDEELMAQYAGQRNNKKRKSEHNTKHASKFPLVEEWQTNHTDPTPWCTIDHSTTANSGLRLHKEICDFYDFVRPYEYEETVRRELINRIESAMRSSPTAGAKNAEIHCFGSFAAGLYLPTADMDLVAVSPEYMRTHRKYYGQTSSQMHKLAQHLQWAGIAAPGGVAVVAKAKVPIIKFVDQLTGIKVDISFENDSGLLANETFRKWKEQFPAMPVIVVLIKQMLAMRGLNEVFSGGIGGFTIICLVVSMMQMMPELQSGSMDPQQHYGDLLLTFLDLYGNKFDIISTGITMKPPGYYSKVHERRATQNNNRLTIIDPNRPDNDISGGSRRIEDVLDCFKDAYMALQRRLAKIHEGEELEGSILGCVWGGNYSSFIRQRDKLSRLHRGYSVSPPPPPPPPAQANGGQGRGKRKRQAAPQPKPQQQAFTPAHATGQRSAHPLPARPSVKNAGRHY